MPSDSQKTATQEKANKTTKKAEALDDGQLGVAPPLPHSTGVPSGKQAKANSSMFSSLFDVSVGLFSILVVAFALFLVPTFSNSIASFQRQTLNWNVFDYVVHIWHIGLFPWRDRAAIIASNQQRKQAMEEMAERADQQGKVRQSDEIFSTLAQDPTLTRYGDTRIFFRPLRRKVMLSTPDMVAEAAAYGGKVAVHEDSGKPFVMSWGMAEINPFTNELWQDDEHRAGVVCAMDSGASVQFLRIETLLLSGIRTFNSYTLGKEHVVNHRLSSYPRCLQRVMELMCVGDKWVIYCPSEFLDNADNNMPTIFRVDVLAINSHTAPLQRAEDELDYVVRELPMRLAVPRTLSASEEAALAKAIAESPRFTRGDLLRRVTMHEPLPSTPEG